MRGSTSWMIFGTSELETYNADGLGTTLWISAFSILNSLLGDQPSRKDTLPAVLDLCWGAHLLTKDNAVVASGTWTAEDLSDRDATE